jgi:uncharacterized peroxidase-related enzyme
MQRIRPISIEMAGGKQRELMELARKKLGRPINMISTLANSPESLEAYLTCGEILGRGRLGAALREQIALTVAGADHCQYCASAHTALGKGLKLAESELTANLHGESSDLRTAAILEFARAIVDTKGFVDDEVLDRVRRAGCSDAEIAEIVANVAVNIFTNYFNHVAQTEVDFPVVEVGAAVA